VELGTTINSCSLGVANNKMQLAAPEENPSMFLVAVAFLDNVTVFQVLCAR
jgi:hypothetical protein